MDFSDIDAQRLMSPSCWVKRMSANEVVPTHIKVTAAASKKAREAVPHKLNIIYGRRPGQLLDEYGCDKPRNAPIVAYFHGGYWQALNKAQSAYVVEPLYAAGCRVFVIGYDLCPDIKFSDLVEETSEAADFIVKFAAERGGTRLWFVGHSAGGHLITWLAVNGSLAAALEKANPEQHLHIGIIPLSGIFDLRLLIHTDVNDALQLSKEETDVFSPLLQPIPPQNISGKNFTLFFVIVTGDEDSPEIQRQSKLFHEKLKPILPTAQFISLKNVDHFNLVENLCQHDYELTKTIVRLISEGD